MKAEETLQSYGVGVEQLTESAFSLYVDGGKGSDFEELKLEFRKRIEKSLADPNIALLIEAAAHLDEVVEVESEGIFTKSEDPASLVADELIGMCIAEYIAGKRGLFNFVRYDKAKPGILAKLPPFMDDAVGALIAGTMTRLFEE